MRVALRRWFREGVQWRDFERFDFFAGLRLSVTTRSARYRRPPVCDVAGAGAAALGNSSQSQRAGLSRELWLFSNDPQGALSRIWTMIVDPKALRISTGAERV